ncbi:transposase IS66 [Rhodobacteraceae bacterium KLH11]|nr:transposase IS66 [Rhodobacteraceae bacterium KLH11]EEE35106.1 transposase IS66 [Rhodobacteraceae bacterium KLH11]EEE35346.1 transposase IS66 [Rhodobacteraceae bacterium KLH11]EEE35385.1 transposase IS66 [Rhodobacteraceae bacterium KLH11]EEE35407.1 transposase IS66 [Rhodobacteraceae bacterium KLH11]
MIAAADLPDDIDALKAMIVAQGEQNARLETLVAALRKALFGRKSEKVDPDQFELALEDIETGIAQIEAEGETNPLVTPTRTSAPRQSNRGSLPKHLPRIEEVIEPDSTICGCGSERHVIGEDISERLDIVPAQFRVIVTRRPKYACRSCEEGIVQAPAPAHLIPGGMPTEAAIAHVIVSKYADHTPLYRQAQIYARQGIVLDRSTLAAWVGRAAFELRPVYDALMADLKRSTKLFMDETVAPVLDPGRKKTKTGYFWALARDDRPWSGDDPPGVAFTYAPGRAGEYAKQILEGFNGTLQVDGYAGYNRLLKRQEGSIRLAHCWAHARRKLFDVAKAGKATPIADEGIAQIQALYRIEKEIRGQSPATRNAVRQERSKPTIDQMEFWLRETRSRVSAKSPIGEALSYIAKHWEGLTMFLDDGRVELDSNSVERTIRPIALNRKNALFAGHDVGAQNWAILASMIETCKLNGIDPHAWLTQTLTAIARGHKQSQINDLLPWNHSAQV